MDDLDALLIVGDTIRCPDARVGVGHAILDDVLVMETSDRRIVAASLHERSRFEAEPAVEIVTIEELGEQDLRRQGHHGSALLVELAAALLERHGVTRVGMQSNAPWALVEGLKAHGFDVAISEEAFADRRRRKDEAAVDAITRTLDAAFAGVEAVRERLGFALTDP